MVSALSDGIMAFDFKKETGRGAGGGNPFEENGNGRPFGGSNHNSAGGGSSSSGGGFQFGGGKTEGQSGEGFSNLPARQNESRPNRSRPPQNRRSGRQSTGSADIPWKLIITVLVIITVFCLIVANWDLIVYTVSQIIAMLVILIVLIFILKMMFRRR